MNSSRDDLLYIFGHHAILQKFTLNFYKVLLSKSIKFILKILVVYPIISGGMLYLGVCAFAHGTHTRLCVSLYVHVVVNSPIDTVDRPKRGAERD